MSGQFFSESYAVARSRFLDQATRVGATLESYSIDADPRSELAIDVAILGPADGPPIVVSSGLHGVEGFFGSAIQLAWLMEHAEKRRLKLRFVFVHGLNPFGFAELRRFDQGNVDLNRNFIDVFPSSARAPEGYRKLHRLLNPESPPSPWEPFRAKAIFNIARFGLNPLKQAVAGGQYEYPRGIFFGGKQPSPSTRIVMDGIEDWVGTAERILHIDFHSGLGEYARYKLLLAEAAGAPELVWYEAAFGASLIEPSGQTQGTAYQASGGMGEWLQGRFAERDYRFVTAEFGTYSPIRVLGAVRNENRAHHFASPESGAYRAAKAELLECFCPADPRWREAVVTAGLRIIRQGAAALEEAC